MYSDSRKAQHNSFAHHRAELLFSKPTLSGQRRKQPALAPTQGPTLADHTQSLQQRVSAGILGFVPAPAAAIR
jgi:hypothetical protein